MGMELKETLDKLMNTNWWEKFVKFVFDILLMVYVWIMTTVVKVRQYMADGEWTKQHLSFVKEGNRFNLVVKDHVDFVEEVEIEIAKYRGKRWGKKFIRYVLGVALSGCNFVTFECDDMFCQFWTARGRLQMDIPFAKGNGLKKYYYSVMGLLTDMNYFKYPFTRTGITTILKVPEHFTFRVDEEEKFIKIVGFFDKRVDQAVEFVDRLFREVYVVKKGMFKVSAG